MASRTELTSRYRKMAEEVRALAKTITSEESRATMLRLAEAYEQAAEKLERAGDASGDAI